MTRVSLEPPGALEFEVAVGDARGQVFGTGGDRVGAELHDGLRDAFDPRQRRIPKTKELSKEAITKAETEVAE